MTVPDNRKRRRRAELTLAWPDDHPGLSAALATAGPVLCGARRHVTAAPAPGRVQVRPDLAVPWRGSPSGHNFGNINRTCDVHSNSRTERLCAQPRLAVFGGARNHPPLDVSDSA